MTEAMGPRDLTMSSDISLLVVGGGPAGVTAALQACSRPKSTATVNVP